MCNKVDSEIVYKLNVIINLLTPISEYCRRHIEKEDREQSMKEYMEKWGYN